MLLNPFPWIFFFLISLQYYKSKELMIGAYHKPTNEKEIELCVKESMITGNFIQNRTFPWSKDRRKLDSILMCS